MKLSTGSARSRRAGLVSAAVFLTASAFAQSKADPVIPRMPDGKPSFVGYWNLPYTPNMAAKDGEASVPYTDAGRAAFKNHDAKDDPTSLCLYPGMPRIMQSPYPVQVLQTPEYLIFAFEYMRLWRVIPMDGRPHPQRVEPSFMGDSVGHWEGDTFVVETIGLNDKTWLDTAGHQHSDQMRVIERFTRTDPGTIQYEVTIDDPNVYTRPWKVSIPLTRDAEYVVYEYACHEGNQATENILRGGRANDAAAQ